MKRYKIFGLLAAAVFAAAFWGCSDDKDVMPLAKSDITAGDASYNSLTFTWGNVVNARQYSYQLVQTDNDNVIQTGITKDTSVSFTGLQHDTEYTLTVLAYAAMGSEYTTSDPIVLTARTNDLTTLDTPVPTWSREVNTIIATWDAVTGARDYAYTLTDAEGNRVGVGSTYDTYVSFTNMQTGTYTLSVTAECASEGFRDSKPGTLVFDFVRERVEIWRASGTYNSILLGKSWDAEIVAYDDNSYELLSWYGAEGYNFAFSLDETDASDMFRPGSSYEYDSATDSYNVPTGISTPSSVRVFASGNRCAFDGGADNGSVTLSVSDGTVSGNDTFEWSMSIEIFVGTWTCDFAGYDSSGDSSSDSFYNGEVSIVLGTEPNTLMVPLPLYYNNSFGTGTMVVDPTTMTFSIEPASFTSGGYEYILSGAASETTPLTGKISKTGITFDAIQIWCVGYSYLSDDSYLKYTR